MFYRKTLLGKSPFGWSPRLPHFILNSVISDSTIARSIVLFQTMRSISLSNNTQMPVETKQETQVCESSQMTIGKFCVCLLKAIQVPPLKNHWDSHTEEDLDN